MKILFVIILAFLVFSCVGLSDKVITERLDKIESGGLERDAYLATYLAELGKHYNNFVETYNKHLEEYHKHNPSIKKIGE